ncbi:DUF3073 domain-containing protein [Thermobispora bispora]|uniref:DUF3073 domain-containing protein n=1 Tax=Thermobispora bispora (strain ATCC 19993 / DSM 43833 / CBS 139.67 / JCM 10125 / KCTC 9307 / NBRC 14880 / R51) TaxID=469371 RepID=D6Y9K4_THEBD|nr:DUF3073 domain-containing protein [Thermobispora bispora]ADG90035.1 hypothetical protein Tbis_3345 [Thermobispora bispora DSM 43833]
MGRGRAKAKQVKVARQLKYNSGGTDLERLRVELGLDEGSGRKKHDPYEELARRYADYGVDDEDDDEAGDSGQRGR